MRLGLLGGSFNPVHTAHVQIALAARDGCRLARVFFVPAADPPHKPLAGDVSFEHRCNMVRLAIADEPDFELSTAEGEREGKSYSIDTIRYFAVRYPGAGLFFIIGGDSFPELGTWHRYRDIFSSCSLIVVERPGCRFATPFNMLPAAVQEEFSHDAATGDLLHRSGNRISFITGVPRDISSTEIRRLAAGGGNVSGLVPPDVAAYISQQRIYSQCP